MTRARGIAAALAALALAACTRVGPGGKTADGHNPWTRPNVLTISTANDPKNLDPVLASASPTLELSAFLFSYTVRYDDRARPVPDAVSEIPTVENGDVSRDGLTLRYRLRHDIRFHDGVPLTCEDLKFTWRVMINPHNNVVTTDGYKDIRDVDCRDPFVAVVHMKKLYAPFLQQLWSVNGNAPILPRHVLERYNDAKGSFNDAPFQSAPIGSGPYRFVSWERGSAVRMRAFHGYFRGTPAIDEVVFRVVPDENTLATLLVTHEIDVLFSGTGAIWNRIRRVPGTIAIAPPIYAYDHVDFNLRRPMFADIRLREALADAIDRPAILEKVQHGLGELAEADQSPSIGAAYDPTVPRRRYDVAKAASLLDAAGWKRAADGVRRRNGRRLEFTISTPADSAVGKAEQTLVQAYWAAVGARAIVKNAPTSAFYDNTANGVLQGGHYDVAVFTWFAAADPDDSPIYSGDNFAPHGQNALFWNDRIATNAMNAALQTVDMKRRIALYHVVQQRLASQVPTIILFFRHEPQVYNDDLRGLTATPVITTPFWNPWTYRL